MDIIIPNAWHDEPDVRDYLREELEIGGGMLPEAVDWFVTPVQNQRWSNRTLNACWSFSNSHAINIGNWIEWTYWLSPKTTTTGSDLWERQLTNYRGSLTEGSRLQDNVKQAKDEGYISWYVLCRSKEKIQEALAKKRTIQTGSRNIRYDLIGKDNIAVRGEWPGHLFCLEGYNKIGFIARDSSWPDRWDNGRFIIPYDMFDVLYSCYAIIDMENKDLIDKVAQDRELLDKAKELGIWNGRRPTDPATREEVVLMLMRQKEKDL